VGLKMSFISSWFSSPEDTTDKKNATKVYNTFNDSPSSSLQPFPTGILSPTFSINGETKSVPLSDSVGIDIYETYNTSGKLPVLNGSNELQNMSSGTNDAIKCCKMCRKLYKEEENSEWACKYHRGRYQASTTFTSFGSLKRWSCCFKEVENGEGCTAGRHQEDRRVTGILNTFNPISHNNESQDSLRTPEKSPKRVPKTPEKRKGEVKHQIQREDTLQSLAIKYNVTLEAIRKANKLFSDQIFARKFLVIPEEI